MKKIDLYTPLEHKAAGVKAYLDAFECLQKLHQIEDHISRIQGFGGVVPESMSITRNKYSNELRYFMTVAKIHERLASSLNKLVEDVSNDNTTGRS